jgi:hypothetical protein
VRHGAAASDISVGITFQNSGSHRHSTRTFNVNQRAADNFKSTKGHVGLSRHDHVAARVFARKAISDSTTIGIHLNPHGLTESARDLLHRLPRRLVSVDPVSTFCPALGAVGGQHGTAPNDHGANHGTRHQLGERKTTLTFPHVLSTHGVLLKEIGGVWPGVYRHPY